MNNRQNGRRRGRGGQQARNGQPGGLNNGSRLDNRARGNAAQLLEKYKTLARDAQMQGDRVNTEYYLQFADHYFRVLSENRARFEEQRPRQQADYRDEMNGVDDEGDYGQSRQTSREEDGEDDRWFEGGPAQHHTEQPREARRERETRNAESERQGEGERRGDGRRDRGRRNGGAAPPQVNGGNGNGSDGGDDHGFAAPDFLAEPLQPRFEAQPASDDGDVLDSNAAAAEPPKRRRGRRPQNETPPVEA
jgi:hypothetical protein